MPHIASGMGMMSIKRFKLIGSVSIYDICDKCCQLLFIIAIFYHESSHCVCCMSLLDCVL